MAIDQKEIKEGLDIRTFSLMAFEGHTGAITQVSISADGKLGVSASRDKTVRLWALDTGQCLHSFQHKEDVTCVALSLEGNYILSGSLDHTARVWSTKTGECLQTFSHKAGVSAVAFTPDPDKMITACDGMGNEKDCQIRIWSLKTGQCEKIFQGFKEKVSCVALSADGKFLAAGSHDKTTRLWAFDNPAVCLAVCQHKSYVGGINFSPDNQTFFSASSDATIQQWSLQGKPLQKLSSPRMDFNSVIFLDNQTLVTGAEDKSCWVWSLPSGKCVEKIYLGSSVVSFYKLPGRQSQVFVGFADGRVRFQPFISLEESLQQVQKGLQDKLEVIELQRQLKQGEQHQQFLLAKQLAGDTELKKQQEVINTLKKTLEETTQAREAELKKEQDQAKSLQAALTVEQEKLTAELKALTVKLEVSHQRLTETQASLTQVSLEKTQYLEELEVLKTEEKKLKLELQHSQSALKQMELQQQELMTKLATLDSELKKEKAVQQTLKEQNAEYSALVLNMKALEQRSLAEKETAYQQLKVQFEQTQQNHTKTKLELEQLRIKEAVQAQELKNLKENPPASGVLAQKIDYQELVIEKAALGKGNYGIVYKASWRHGDVAVKEVLCDLSPNAAKEFEKEVHLMAKLRCQHVVSFYGYCPQPRAIVMEYMPNGSLYNALRKQNLGWDIRIRIAGDIAAGLAFLHREQILHRDVKSLNVLLDGQLRAKLTDFGLSTVKTETRHFTRQSMAAKSQEVKEAADTIAWMAPELLKRHAKYTSQCDIYSFGITLWEISSGKTPYSDAKNPGELTKWIENGQHDDIPQHCPSKISTLIEACWESEPQKRPDSEQVASYLRSGEDDFSAFLTAYAALKKQAPKLNVAGNAALPQETKVNIK
jgi:hypothetical protein